jgi:hypothetical protein
MRVSNPVAGTRLQRTVRSDPDPRSVGSHLSGCPFRFVFFVFFVSLWFNAVSSPRVAAEAPMVNLDATTFFESDVRPVLAENCYACHGPRQQMAGLRLDSREGLSKGTAAGPVLVPGDPDRSPLIRAVRYDGKIRMPPAGKLKAGQIASLEAWVRMGATWPDARSRLPVGAGSQVKPSAPTAPAARRFWSFVPVRKPPLPAVTNIAWVQSPLDRFILAAMDKRGLRPAPAADRRTLIRRATFDLTGLPPTPAEVNAFLSDRSPDPFARVIDRLLASPHYGERWGRHWLDVVRYADSFDARVIGNEMDINEAWRYRDWVVDAFNRDLPYNQFILHQIAGDRLPVAKAGAINIPGIIATGMLAIGNWGGGDADKEKLLTDIADDQVDVISRGFMGLTVACARCHDHKFDPITAKDYYALAGIFFSTHILPNPGPKTNGPPMLRIPLVSPAEMERRQQYQAQVADREKQLKAARDSHYQAFARNMLPETARYLVAAWDYRNRPPSEADLSLAEFASRRILHDYALRQWLDYLGVGDFRLMTSAVRDLLGNPGVHAWRGGADTPSLIVNTNDEARTILSFVLPPHSVAVHPGPRSGVVVVWKSPFTGTVRITGRVADADPGAGDGVAWALEHLTAAAARELASGDIPNGGAQEIADASLAHLTVKAGEAIQLLILPKESHTCDTTLVELTIAAQDSTPGKQGPRVWSLPRDVVEDVGGPDTQAGHSQNPFRDRRGNAGVWQFADMANSSRTRKPAGAADDPLAAWNRAVTAPTSGPPARTAILRAAEQFQQSFRAVDATSPFWINAREDEKVLSPQARADLAKQAGELEALKKNAPAPFEYANGALEGGCPESPQAGIHDVRVHIRGSYQRLGDLVPRRFPIVLAGERQVPIREGSGRLELAHWIASGTHPLTARVIVNRVWQHHFGEGIVRTPSNFGFMGERPSHPELLDYLAWQFVGSGWSIKRLHREIMLSAAYQQSGIAPARSLRADPDNRLFSRMNRRRLEAESVRDSLLAVAGRLDGMLGGPSTRDFSSPRRTLYLMTIRSDGAGFGPLFDAADSTASIDRRTVSTVAPQALFLLNNPFVLEQTRALARRVLETTSLGDTDRIQATYLLLYGRPPTIGETRLGRAFLARARHAVLTSASQAAMPDRDLQAWDQYCQVLLCANEFIYVD